MTEGVDFQLYFSNRQCRRKKALGHPSRRFLANLRRQMKRMYMVLLGTSGVGIWPAPLLKLHMMLRQPDIVKGPLHPDYQATLAIHFARSWRVEVVVVAQMKQKWRCRLGSYRGASHRGCKQDGKVQGYFRRQRQRLGALCLHQNSSCHLHSRQVMLG